MTPMDVDPLFDANPGLFAYELPSPEERARIDTGDLVKLFFEFHRLKYPKPIWMTVISVEGTGDCPYTGVLAEMEYRPGIKSHFTEPVRFGTRHLYRVPMDRPEVEHANFDSKMRS